MKRRTKELLLAFALWLPGVLAYTCSFSLPWFTLNQPMRAHLHNPTASRAAVDGSQALITGLDAMDFLLERLKGGCFVWLAHPVLWLGWVLLVSCRWRAAAAAGCVALLLAFNAPLVFQPRQGPWLPPQLGYYLWFASMALLACSAWLRNYLLPGAAVADKELRQLAAREARAAAELAELKQQVAVLFDQQAASLLDEMETR
jgi:hypothetical protein